MEIVREKGRLIRAKERQLLRRRMKTERKLIVEKVQEDSQGATKTIVFFLI